MRRLLLRVSGQRTPSVQFSLLLSCRTNYSAEICSLFLGLVMLSQYINRLFFFGNHSITFIAGNQGATLRAIKQAAHIHSFAVVANLSCCFRIINLIPMTSHLCSAFLASKVGCRTLWPCAWPLPLLSEELEGFVLFLYYFFFILHLPVPQPDSLLPRFHSAPASFERAFCLNYWTLQPCLHLGIVHVRVVDTPLAPLFFFFFSYIVSAVCLWWWQLLGAV